LPTITLVGTTALDEPQVCVHDASPAFSTPMFGERLGCPPSPSGFGGQAGAPAINPAQ